MSILTFVLNIEDGCRMFAKALSLYSSVILYINKNGNIPRLWIVASCSYTCYDVVQFRAIRLWLHVCVVYCRWPLWLQQNPSRTEPQLHHNVLCVVRTLWLQSCVYCTMRVCMFQGNPVGQSGLGLMYMYGRGVEQVRVHTIMLISPTRGRIFQDISIISI